MAAASEEQGSKSKKSKKNRGKAVQELPADFTGSEADYKMQEIQRQQQHGLNPWSLRADDQKVFALDLSHVVVQGKLNPIDHMLTVSTIQATLSVKLHCLFHNLFCPFYTLD